MNGPYSYNFDPVTGKPVSAPPKPVKPQRSFTTKEKVLAWVSALVGYLFCRTFWVWQKPIFALVFTVCLFAFAFVFFGRRKRKARSWFYPASALVFACAFFFSASPVLLFFAFAYILVAFLLFCQTGSETALEERAGKLYVFETVKALFVAPFRNIGAALGAIGTNKGGKKIGKTLLIILIGVGVALIPTLIVLALLSYDANFTDILEKIREAIFDKIFERIWSFVIGAPIGMYVYAALYTSAHPVPDGFNAENCENVENKMKFAPTLVGAVAIAPLIFLYAVFIAAQHDYYKAVFTATLPDAYTFAEFARGGFFRLCAVAAINAVALIALRVFTKKAKNGEISPLVRVYTVVLSLITAVISCTAISQMVMYVSAYGLTRLRLYALWFMALLTLLFLVAALKQLIKKLPFAAVCLTLCVLCFGLLAVPDTDAIMAKYNYDCYLKNSKITLDVEYLGALAPSSVPTLCEIAENGDLPADLRASALRELGKYAAEDDRPYNLPAILASRAYEGLNRKTQLRAAVAYDLYCPRVYRSEETQRFAVGGAVYNLTLCRYDKNDEAAFSENSAYAPLKSDDRAAVGEIFGRYSDACKKSVNDDRLPVALSDLSQEGRFLVVREDLQNSDRRRARLYLYDRTAGTLLILKIEKTA